MLKLKMLALLFLISLSAQSYYEDNTDVIRLSESGDYTIIENSEECPQRFRPGNEKDLLVGVEGALCLESLEVPLEVKNEVAQMKEAELENESDYDQRVTSLLSFRWSNFKGASFSNEDLLKFALAMNIPSSHLKEIQAHAEKVTKKTFSHFDDLFLGLEFFRDSQLQDWLYKSLKGQFIQVVSFGDGVELYPGGGFYVTHYLFIAKDKAFYVKLSWWNS